MDIISPTLLDYTKATKVIKSDGYYAKTKTGLPVNFELLEGASDEQVTSFIAYRHGLRSDVIPYMPELSISLSRFYTAMFIVDRGNKTFLETVNGFKIARLKRATRGINLPVLNFQGSIIINRSQYKVTFNYLAFFFAGLVTEYWKGRKKSDRKLLAR